MENTTAAQMTLTAPPPPAPSSELLMYDVLSGVAHSQPQTNCQSALRIFPVGFRALVSPQLRGEKLMSPAPCHHRFSNLLQAHIQLVAMLLYVGAGSHLLACGCQQRGCAHHTATGGAAERCNIALLPGACNNSSSSSSGVGGSVEWVEWVQGQLCC
jgi:hypothetical protein